MPSPAISDADFFAGLGAQKAAREAVVNGQLIAKLKDNGVFSDDQMGPFKRHAVDYYERKRENPQRPQRNSRSHQRDVEAKFETIPQYDFVPMVVNYIEKHVSNDRCVQVYEDVISVIPSSWERQASTLANPRQKVETPFSVARAAPGSVKSNAQLIDILASATDMSPGTAIMIRGQITFWDSKPPGKDSTSGMLCCGERTVSGGRLGRDHMLSDTPNHYVRDRLMDYINTVIEEGKQDKARKAVFFDLNPAEIEEYADLIRQKTERDKPRTTEESIALVMGGKRPKSYGEMNNVLNLADAVEEVYKYIDMTPRPRFGRRGSAEPIYHSVVQLGLKEYTPEEGLWVGTDIDRDCDQIRAMIAQLADGKEWTVDQFRLALGDVSRQQLTNFLIKWGSEQGQNSVVFPLAWEFFKKREMLGLPLMNTPDNSHVLQERNSNTQSKRPSDSGKRGEGSRKRTRKA